MNDLLTAEQLEWLTTDHRDSEDGSWGRPEEEDVNMLYDIFQAIMRAKLDPDYEDSFAIQIKLIDRTRHWKLYFVPIRRNVNLENPTSVSAHLRDLLCNVSIASGELERFMKGLEWVAQEDKKHLAELRDTARAFSRFYRQQYPDTGYHDMPQEWRDFGMVLAHIDQWLQQKQQW